MSTFAVMKNGRSPGPGTILMLLDERLDADEIVFELRRHGQDVAVREVRAAIGVGGRSEWMARTL